MKILWPWGRYSFSNPLFLLWLLLFDLSVNPLHLSSLTCMAISLSDNWTEWSHFYHFYFTRNWWVSPFLSLHNIYSHLQLSLLHLSILLSLNVFYEHFIDTFSLHSFFPSTPLHRRLLPPLLYSSCSSSSLYSPSLSSPPQLAKHCTIGMSYDPSEQLEHGGMIFPGRHVLGNYHPGEDRTNNIHRTWYLGFLPVNMGLLRISHISVYNSNLLNLKGMNRTQQNRQWRDV